LQNTLVLAILRAMKQVVKIGLLLAALNGFASLVLADQRLNVNVPGGSAEDMLNTTNVPADVSNLGSDPTLPRSCTNSIGRVIRKGEDGYDDCMASARGHRPKPSPGPSDDGHTITIQSR
jgi:hypothetical protein